LKIVLAYKTRKMFHFRHVPALLLLALCAGTSARAQLSLGSAVDLALRTSPRVKMAQSDVAKARAALAQARYAFVPQVSASGGVGKGTGAPLSVPTIFSMNAQSLAFSVAQIEYIRSAQHSVAAAEHVLRQTQFSVAQETTDTYVTLDNALERRAIMEDESGIARNLMRVTDDRVTAGVDAHIEIPKARRTEAQIRLQSLLVDDEIDNQAQHLATLTGIPARGLKTVRSSIPAFHAPTPMADEGVSGEAMDEGLAAAHDNIRAKRLQAAGDRHAWQLPQIAFGASYARANVDPAFSSYLDYYPRYAQHLDPDTNQYVANTMNSFSVGFQITVPILDMLQRAKARGTEAEAAHAMAEADQQRGLFRENRLKLRHAALELAARQELADADHEVAQDQLAALRVQLQANAGNLQGTQMTRKDELNATLQERQKAYDVLAAELTLHQTQITLLQQNGGLGDWLHGTIGGTVTPAPIISAPAGLTPLTPGVSSAPVQPGAAPSTSAPTSTGAPAPPQSNTPLPQ
jgi:outer membrane protein TolC